METSNELYLLSKSSGKLSRCFDVMLESMDSDEEVVLKSSNTKVSEYVIKLTTLATFDTYKTYSMALNEMSASFSLEDDSILELILRDTSVNKKITFSEDKAILTVVNGQDTVGEHSEVLTSTIKERIHSISINDITYDLPYNLASLYQDLTGIDLEARDESLNWWTAIINDDKSEVE